MARTEEMRELSEEGLERSDKRWSGASGGRREKGFASFYSQEVGQNPLDNERYGVQ